MRTSCLPLLLAAFACVQPASPQKQQPPKPGAVAAGVFTDQAGKPIPKARLYLAQVLEDAEFLYATVKLTDTSATSDENGRFEFKGFEPGVYTIVYVFAGGPTVLPAQIGIKSFSAVEQNPMPLLPHMEIGKGENRPEKPWGRQFTLMKGHTFFSEGPHMKIWNATIRRGPAGPFLEIRKGVIWLDRLTDKSQIKFTAWTR
jgi:hypothetical protein